MTSRPPFEDTKKSLVTKVRQPGGIESTHSEFTLHQRLGTENRNFGKAGFDYFDQTPRDPDNARHPTAALRRP